MWRNPGLLRRLVCVTTGVSCLTVLPFPLFVYLMMLMLKIWPSSVLACFDMIWIMMFNALNRSPCPWRFCLCYGLKNWKQSSWYFEDGKRRGLLRGWVRASSPRFPSELWFLLVMRTRLRGSIRVTIRVTPLFLYSVAIFCSFVLETFCSVHVFQSRPIFLHNLLCYLFFEFLIDFSFKLVPWFLLLILSLR